MDKQNMTQKLQEAQDDPWMDSQMKLLEELAKQKENPEKFKKTVDEIEKEKASIIQQIKDLEEDFYKPKNKMADSEIDQITQDLLSHPLFLKEIPENIEDNPHLQALQAMQYDDEPENIAKYCVEKGNEYFKKGSDKSYYLNQAFKSYTEGIEAEGRDQLINSKLYNNRALLQIKKRNYGKAIQDCKDSILANPSFVKPYYRISQALIYLMKYKEAIKFLEKGLQIEPKNKEISKLLNETKVKYEKENLKIQEKKDFKKEEQTVLFNALKIRNIYLGKAIMDFPDSCYKSCWVDDQTNLHFPVFIQYPEFQQMDYIQDISESDIFKLHVEQLFGGDFLPYDTQKVYNTENVECYIELNIVEPYYPIKNVNQWPKGRGLVRVNLNQKFSKVMSTKGFVLPRVAEIFMVCPESKDFYAHFKKNFDFIVGI